MTSAILLFYTEEGEILFLENAIMFQLSLRLHHEKRELKLYTTMSRYSMQQFILAVWQFFSREMLL